ncbi:hypothetical protein G4Y79_20840 [Phototrophicus methaneseepsis]|uniref:Phage head morphogenesis domain-containing protein n=1 Tax=Phototrophicus methaneseepsis TaxID=2710758 RepID=A0A7S8E844_9CHLR|nr:phage minor head protein [Phototrophicus methaneseepsis]QPC82104.1 hypothetical protein G4Y79_20840 [Phototrophicus methaneseepsis]
MAIPGDLTHLNQADRVLRARDGWRRELADQERETAQRLLAAYERTVPEMQRRMDSLIAEIQRLEAAGDATTQRVRELNAYQKMMERVDYEMTEFQRILSDEMSTASDSAIEAGSRIAQDMVEIMGGSTTGVFLGGWNEPDPAAIRTLADYLSREAMQDKLSSFSENAVLSLEDLILTHVAQGKNPRELARRLSQWTNTPYYWSENMARTVQVYSYRGATHASYLANEHVVQGWVWSAACDRRTCISCWNMHGQEFSNQEILNDHHKGRCTPLPMVRNVYRSITSGEERFRQLSAAEQRQIMGPGLYDAWRRDDVQFRDFTRTYRDDVYGTMRRAATLNEARGR